MHVGGRGREKPEGRLQTGIRKLFGAMDIFIILTVVMGSHYLDCGDGVMVYTYVKTYRIVYFIICQLHLKKAVWKKAERKLQNNIIYYLYIVMCTKMINT